MMSKVGPLLLFGVTLVVGGIYWMLWEGSREYLNNILVEDSYYTLIFWVWRMIPAILLISGMICLISAGIIVRQRKGVIEY